MIYLDYSANTPVDPRVLEVYCRTEQNFIGNPNSTHCAGQAARQEMNRVTGLIAAQLGVHDTLCAELQKRPGVRINSPAGAVPHIVNVSVAGIKAGVFQQALSGQGVCVSVKSACSTDGTPSKAVFAVSRDRKNALSSWRISLSHLTTEEELNGFLAAFDRCMKDLQKEK